MKNIEEKTAAVGGELAGHKRRARLPKIAPAAKRSVVWNVRFTEEYFEWCERFQASLGGSRAEMVDEALTMLSRVKRFESPPPLEPRRLGKDWLPGLKGEPSAAS